MAKSNVKYPIVGDPKNNKGVYDYEGDPVESNKNQNPMNQGGGTYDPKTTIKGMSITANQRQNAVKMAVKTIGKKFRNKFGG